MHGLRQCIAAFRFLTIFPIPGAYGTDAEDLKGALLYFPVVGLVLGLLSGAAAWMAWNFLPAFVAAVIISFLLLSFSGALHLDGLADTADGFFSSRDRVRILEIMRDSRVGVMGVTALVMILLLKVSVFAGMENKMAAEAGFLAPVAGRSALVLMVFVLPYVRKESGLGTPFYFARNGWALVLALFLFLGSCIIVQGLAGLVAGSVVLVLIFFFSRLCQRKIDGATGDTLGASCELAETMMLFSFVFF